MQEEQFIIQHLMFLKINWHHVALTRQSGTMYSFWDGQLLDSK